MNDSEKNLSLWIDWCHYEIACIWWLLVHLDISYSVFQLTISDQVIHIVCKNRRNQYWLTTGSQLVTRYDCTSHFTLFIIIFLVYVHVSSIHYFINRTEIQIWPDNVCRVNTVNVRIRFCPLHLTGQLLTAYKNRWRTTKTLSLWCCLMLKLRWLHSGNT